MVTFIPHARLPAENNGSNASYTLIFFRYTPTHYGWGGGDKTLYYSMLYYSYTIVPFCKYTFFF